jgi:hypothetical protein
LKTNRLLILLMVLIALLPPYVEPAAYADSEDLCQFLVVVSAVSAAIWSVTDRKAFLFLFGVAAAGAALVRPTYQYVVPAMSMALLFGKATGIVQGASFWRFLRALCIPMVISTAALGGYAVFNYVHFGYLGLSSMAPYTLSCKTASFVEDLPVEYAEIRSILLKHRDRALVAPFSDHTAQSYIHQAMPEVIQSFGNDKLQAVRALERANLYLIVHHPISYLIESLKALAIYWLPEEANLANADSSLLRALWAALQLAVVGLTLALAAVMTAAGAVAAGAVVWKRSGMILPSRVARQAAAYLVCLTIISYTALISSFAGMGIPRYRQTSDLVILASCVLGISLFRQCIEYAAQTIKRQGE